MKAEETETETEEKRERKRKGRGNEMPEHTTSNGDVATR